MTFQMSQGGILIERGPFVPGTVKPEEDYAELERLSAKLGIPCPQSFIELQSVDADGNVVSFHKDRSRTLNRNFWNYLFMMFGPFTAAALDGTGFNPPNASSFGAGFLSFKVAGGSLVSTGVPLCAPYAVAAANAITTGIVVGTGTAAENFDGFALATPIAAGTGAGQLSYQAQVAGTTSYNSGTLTWTGTSSRIMNNNTASTIGVNETAIYAGTISGGSASTTSLMISRDKLGSTVNILAGGQLTVTYTHTLTFPA